MDEISAEVIADLATNPSDSAQAGEGSATGSSLARRADGVDSPEPQATHLVATQPRGMRPAAVATDATARRPVDPANAVEALILSPGGAIFVVGWVDDEFDPVRYLVVRSAGWRVELPHSALARVRRRDAEAVLGGAPRPLGYFSLVFDHRLLNSGQDHQVELHFDSGAVIRGGVSARTVSDEELRDIALSYVAGSEYLGGPMKAIACLDRDLGANLIALNKTVVDRIISAPHIRRFGPAPADLIGSLVICLYGKLEYLFVQCALFAGLPGIERYELIYVCNSPHLAEALLTEARAAALIYGVSLTLVILPGNAGFAGANNVAAKAARSDRLLFVNPDVFPKDPSWALKHTALLLSRPELETRLFGSALFYDDGSLMHAGMYFELDDGVAFEGAKLSTWRLLRVEHYGKGAPANSSALLRPRAVPAVTGAFISVKRDWFEALGGFSTDYIFGHYEDADLCVRSHQAGATPWIHDLKLWHLEGKGSTRLPVHEGGSLVNRWLFSSRWGELITADVLGREPAHPAFRDEA